MLISASFTTACEKAEIQQIPTSTVPIVERSCPIDDCQDCPVDDCCCFVQLLSNPGLNPVSLDFCGTSGDCPTTMTCSTGTSGLGNCPDINGFKETITLQNQFQTELFCVPKNAAFGITSATGGGGQPIIRVSCQVGQANPQIDTIQLNTPPRKPYWSTGSDCSIPSCF